MPNAPRTPVRRWASSAEAMAYLGVSKPTLYKIPADGRITAYRAGPRLIRYDLNEIDAAMVPSGGAE